MKSEANNVKARFKLKSTAGATQRYMQKCTTRTSMLTFSANAASTLIIRTLCDIAPITGMWHRNVLPLVVNLDSYCHFESTTTGFTK
jgi:hypothetical protein